MTMATATNRPNLVATLDSVLNSLGAKRVKAGEANTETGGYGTTTTHPSKDVDDGTRPASQGTRGEEFDRDLKSQEDIGNHSPPPVKTQDALQPNMGVKQVAISEESGVSQRESGDTPPDGGTYYGTSEHPARTDNEEIEKKYASASPRVRQLLTMVSRADTLGRQLAPVLAKRASQMLNPGQQPDQSSPPANKPGQPAQNKAAAATQTEPTQAEKQAFDRAVVLTLADVVHTAHANAVKLAAVLTKSSELAAAPAEDEEESEDESRSEKPSDEEMLLAAVDKGDGGEGGPPAGGNDPLAQILADSQSPGGPPPGDMAGGPPPGDTAEGPGDMVEGPGDMAGGPPPGDTGEGQMSPEEEMMLMQEAMAQQGVTPEMLQGSLAGKVANLVNRVTKTTKSASAGSKPQRWKPKTAKQARQLEEWKQLVKELVQP